MELFTVLFLNILIAAGLYVGISAQVTKRIRSHMIRRINEEIRSIVDDVQTETESHIELLNSKIQAYKILVQRSDSLEEKYKSILSKLQELPERILSEKSEPSISSFPDSETLVDSELPEEASFIEEIRSTEEDEFKNEYLTLIREKQKEMQAPRTDSLENRRQDLAAKAGEGVGRSYKQNINESQKKEKPFIDPENRTSAKRNLNTDEEITEPNSGTLGILKIFGKKIKETMGWMDPQEVLGQPSPTRPPQPMYNPSSTFDISLDGDPFEENRISIPQDERGGTLKADYSYQSEIQSAPDAKKPKVRDHKIPLEENFEKILEKKISGYTPQKQDSVKISSETALKDLGEGASKIEKVVFLLKKGYSHEEISEALDLATGEVDIIERFRLERNRRV